MPKRRIRTSALTIVPPPRRRPAGGASRHAPFSPFEAIGARIVVGRQVDDVVTDAVKEAYAAGVAAALEGVRDFARRRAYGFNQSESRDHLSAEELEQEIAALWVRLAEWKTPRT